MNNSLKQSIRNIFHLGVKEIRSLMRDPMMLILILYSFSLGIIITANGSTDTITKAAIAVVDDDKSMLSQRITDSFLEPMFLKPKIITHPEIDSGMDRGEYTFVVVFPPDFQKDVLAGNCPKIQVNVDATRMSQAFTGVGYIQQIINQELQKAVPQTNGSRNTQLAELVIRNRFNINLTSSYFDAIVQLINNITMLAIGIFLACKSQNMPQLCLLFILVFLPMNMLSGGTTPLESMPRVLQIIMQASPTTQFVSFSQAILFRGAGIAVVWKEFLALFVIGGILFGYSLIHFRKSVT